MEHENLKFDQNTIRVFEFNKALADFHDLFNLQQKDERSIALIGGTFCEMALEQILKSFLPDDEKQVDKLFEFNQPLGSFSSKISMVLCLGLVDKVIVRDLDMIRKIRNKFAHNLYASFSDSQIKNWCNELKFHQISMMMKAPADTEELLIFQAGVNQVISHLSALASASRYEKRQIKDCLGKFL
jgi:DNA-binding MltR family transcriptional regulator